MRLYFSIGVFCICLASCAKQNKPMEVDVFHLRSTKLAKQDSGMVRGDQNYVLYGKVTSKESNLAKGQYYTITRQDSSRPAEVVFSYLQVATKSKVLRQRMQLAQGQKKAEFKIIGKNFTTNGRVLAWKADLIQDGKIITSEQSYMW